VSGLLDSLGDVPERIDLLVLGTIAWYPDLKIRFKPKCWNCYPGGGVGPLNHKLMEAQTAAPKA